MIMTANGTGGPAPDRPAEFDVNTRSADVQYPAPVWQDCHVLVATPSDKFDVLVPALKPGYAGVVKSLFQEGNIAGCKLDGLLWVSSSDLSDLLCFGQDHYDPECGCFIPHEARKRNIAREQRRRAAAAQASQAVGVSATSPFSRA